MGDNTYSGDFLAGFVVGALVGAAAALLLAPQSGEDTRTYIRDKGIELGERADAPSVEARQRAQELEAQAEEKVVKAEKKEAKVQVARGSQASVIVTKTWEAQVTDIIALAAAVAAGRLPPEVIEPNMRALRTISRETKLEREVDGVRFFEKISTGVR